MICRDLAGIGLALECREARWREAAELDFGGFPLSQAPRIRLQARLGQPQVPRELRERFRGPGGVCFDEGNLRHILYPGPVWVHYDYARETGLVEGLDPEAVYQRLYLTALSRVGELLDRQGRHRVHALGLLRDAEAWLILLPPGGGKSTLAVRLLQREGFRLVSEDTPLLDRQGRLLPFPFRLGLREPHPRGVPRGGKWLVPASVFPLAAEPAPCRRVLVGGWTTGAPALGPGSAAAALVRDCLVGWGLPQVSELFLRLTPGDLARKVAIAASRAWAVSVLLARARAQRLWLGPDPERNADFIASLR